jgi:hypothetical protein
MPLLDLQTDAKKMYVLTGLVPESACQMEEAGEGDGQGEFWLHPWGPTRWAVLPSYAMYMR